MTAARYDLAADRRPAKASFNSRTGGDRPSAARISGSTRGQTPAGLQGEQQNGRHHRNSATSIIPAEPIPNGPRKLHRQTSSGHRPRTSGPDRGDGGGRAGHRGVDEFSL